jgi:hypothetical protein
MGKGEMCELNKTTTKKWVPSSLFGTDDLNDVIKVFTLQGIENLKKYI